MSDQPTASGIPPLAPPDAAPIPGNLAIAEMLSPVSTPLMPATRAPSASRSPRSARSSPSGSVVVTACRPCSLGGTGGCTPSKCG